MANADLGSVSGKLTLDISEWTKNIDKAKASMKGMEESTTKASATSIKNFKAIGNELKSVGKKMTIGFTVPMVLLGRTAVNTAMDMEVAWKEVEKVYGSTADSFQRDSKLLEDSVSALTIRFGKQKVEVLDALASISAMGYEGSNAVDLLTQTLEYGTAGQLDLNEAMSKAVAISKIYGVEGEGLTSVLGLLNTVENTTAASMADLGEAVSITGDASLMAGISIDELSGMIAVFRDRSISAGEGANALKTIFTKLYSPTSDGEAILNKYNIALADSNGKFREADVILKEIAGKWETLTDVEKNELTQSIGGLYHKNKLLALINDLNSETSTYTKTLEAVTDEAANVAGYESEIGKFLDTNRTKVAQTRAKWEEIKEVWGVILIDTLTPLVDKIGVLTDNLAKADPSLQKLIVLGGTILAILGPVLYVIGAIANILGPMGTGIATVAGAVSTLVGKMAFLTPVLTTVWGWLVSLGTAIGTALGAIAAFFGTSVIVIVAIIVAIIALIAGLVLLVKNWDTVKVKLKEFTATAKTELAKFGNLLGEVFEAGIEKINEWYTTIKLYFGLLLESFMEWVSNAKDSIGRFFSETLPLLFEGFVEFIKGLPSRIVSLLGTLIRTFLGYQVYLAGFLIGLIAYGVELLVGSLIQIMGRFFTWFAEFITVTLPTAFNSFTEYLATLPEIIGTKIAEIVITIIGGIASLWASFKNWLVTVKEDLVSFAISTMFALVAFFTVSIPNMIANISKWLSELPKVFATWWNNAKQQAINIWVDTKEWFAREVPAFLDRMQTWFSELPNRIREGMAKLKETMISTFRSAIAGLFSFLQTKLSDFKEWGVNMMKAFVDGFKELGSYLKDMFEKGLEDAKGVIKGDSPPKEGPYKMIDVWGENVGLAWIEGVAKGIGSLGNVLSVSPSLNSPTYSSDRIPSQVANNTVNNSPQFNVHIGTYAGSEMEKRELAKSLWDAYGDYQRGTGEAIDG